MSEPKIARRDDIGVIDEGDEEFNEDRDAHALDNANHVLSHCNTNDNERRA